MWSIRRILAAVLLTIVACAPASAGPPALPSQAPCTLQLGIIHIGLRHATGGKCASTPVPQGNQIPSATTASGSYVYGYSRTCSVQDGRDVCVARSGSHVSTCTKYDNGWKCAETSRKTAAQAACEARAADGVPPGPVMHEASYSSAGANAYYNARDWNAMLAYAGGWTQAEPHDANAWMVLGNAYELGSHNNSAGAAAFRAAVASKPSWFVPYIGLGHAYLDQKCYDLSAAALEKAADRNPTALNYKNAAAVYSYAGRIDLADEMLIAEQKHLRSGADAIDWYNIGCDFNKVDDPAHAAAALHRSLALNGRYANAWNNLGVADENLDKFDEALAEYQKAAALGDSLGSSNHTHLVTLIAQQKAAAHRGRHGGNRYGLVCYDGATTVSANGASGACPPGFGYHEGDRNDDTSSSGSTNDSSSGGESTGGGESVAADPSS